MPTTSRRIPNALRVATHEGAINAELERNHAAFSCWRSTLSGYDVSRGSARRRFVAICITFILVLLYHAESATAAELTRFSWAGITWRIPSKLLRSPLPSEERESFTILAGWRSGTFSACCDDISGPHIRIIVEKSRHRNINEVAAAYNGAPLNPPLPIDRFRYSGSLGTTDFYRYEVIRTDTHPASLICPTVGGDKFPENISDDCRIDIVFSERLLFVVYIPARLRVNAAVIAEQVIHLLISAMSNDN